jgi:hypothetical protein
MDRETRRAMRLLEAYSLATSVALAVIALTAARNPTRPRFAELDVERINVIEKNGTLRLTISNKARLPEPVIGGKSYPLRSGTGAGSAGMIFFNDEGNEDGGLIFQGRRTPQGHQASGGLTFDQYNQDETVALGHGDENGRREAGLRIADRADVSIQAAAESLMVIRRLPDGPEKTRRIEALRTSPELGLASTTRAYIGRGADRAAILVLSDPAGRPRIRMTVDSLGAPRLDFLDESGKITYQLPQNVTR